MEAISEELEPTNEPAWKNVELVLDAIIKHLTVKELKTFRMTCRAWAFAGARQLVRKTLIRLTGIVSLKPVAEKVPVLTGHCSRDADFYEDDRVLEAKPEEYFHMDSYVQYLESASASFDSGFTPKCVSVICASDVWQLPLPHFSSLEDLQVLTFRPSEGLKLLNEFHLLFPKLKSFELRYIQPEAEVGFVDMDSSAAHPAAQEGSEAESSQIVLEKLSLTVSSCWPYIGPEVIQRFRKLKALTLNWTAFYPMDLFVLVDNHLEDGNRYNFDSLQYIDWLQGPEFPVKFSRLSDVSLRFDLLPSTSACARDVLNTMKLKELSLELHGTVYEFSDFVLGLSRNTVASLTKLHSSSIFFDGEGIGVLLDTRLRFRLKETVIWLADNGFFEKAEWALSFRGLSGGTHSWCLFEKTKSYFCYQISTEAIRLVSMTEVVPKLVLQYVKRTSSSYNFSFRNFCVEEKVIKYEFERILPQELFSVVEDFPDCAALPRSRANIRLNSLRRVSREGRPCPKYRCICRHLCRKPSVLLCEIPPFVAEAGIANFPGHFADYRALATFMLCHVQPEVLEKWTGIRDRQDAKRCKKAEKRNLK